jgi:Xaa-Pro aminopeptidase
MVNSIERLRKLFSKYSIDYYVVPSTDEFLGEWVPDYNDRLRYITRFTCSSGVAVISREGKNYFFTDGRYLLQAKKQLDKSFVIKDLEKEKFTSWMIETLKKGEKVGLDPKLHNVTQIDNVIKNSDKSNLVFTDENLIDAIWQDRPLKSLTDIFTYNFNYAGEIPENKLKIVSSFLKEKGVESVVLSNPESICWLLNIRGNDLEFTPIVLCYAIVSKNGPVKLFLSHKPSNETNKYLKDNNVQIFTPNQFQKEISKLSGKVCINKNTSFWIASNLRDYVVEEDPCLLPKACKNKIEINGAIQAHIKDGTAMQECLDWLHANLGKKKITELSLSEKLLEFRQKQKGFFSPSFQSIVGFKDNGAIIHHKATKENHKEIKGNGLLLIDSGGQYFEGTTDITRTIAIGKPTAEQIHNFTLVLKGHIKVLSAVFPESFTGADLDKLAREDLKKEGKDYAHGTGHGVGSFLSVHEGPQSISSKGVVKLQPGMILSIEPGFYKEGEYGIRIESLAYVKKAKKSGYLEFVVLTKVPIDEKLVDFNLLTPQEKEWLQEYN